MSPRPLERYRSMRDFDATPEPAGARAAGAKGKAGAVEGLYVVQKHAARRLHYDFRLELDGVLKSWAVPREPSLDSKIKRLAVEVEDHPVEYAKFKGTIPKGHYGAGKVEIFDRGRWRPEGDPRAGIAEGRLHFALEGGKLAGRWILVRMEGRDADPKKPQWLLMRAKEQPGDEAKAARRLAPPKSAAKSRKKATRRAPLPRHVEFQLASLSPTIPAGDDWLHEIKLDGYRAQASLDGGRVSVRTRRGHDWTGKFPAIAAAVAELDARSAILDGEICALRADGTTDFQALQNALDASRSERLVYCVFDLLHENGEDLMPLPLEERKARLEALLRRSPDDAALRYVRHAVGGGEGLLKDACRIGLEGIIAKRRGAPYVPGRGSAWLKVKCVGRQEFVIGGYTITPGGRGTLAALLLGVHDEKTGALRPVGRTGTGMTAAERAKLLKTLKPLAVTRSPFTPSPPAGDRRGAVTWVKPRHVAEIEFRAWTGDGRLRQASYKGLRLDKDAKDVVREKPGRTSIPRGGVAKGARAAAAAPKDGIRLSNPEKVLFPDVGVTKRALLDYYRVVAERMLPHVAGRALMILRCPNGVGEACFHQKHPAAATGRGTDEDTWLSIRDLGGLERLVQSGALEIHAWGSRLDRLEFPDRLAFDLDPAPGHPWSEVVRAAHDIRARLRELGLESVLKTTGGKGVHIVVPIARRTEWPEAKRFCHDFALGLERDEPKRFTAALAKARRTNKIFVDYLRNGRGATWVVPYSTRARAGATISMPIRWEDLTPSLDPAGFNLPDVLKNGLPRKDVWADLGAIRQSLPRAKGKGNGRAARA